MSLFGYFVIARHPSPVPELPSLQRLCREGTDHISAGHLAGVYADGDWQFVQVLGGSALDAADLLAETGNPAMAIYVVESFFGIVDAAVPDGPGFSACLNPAGAIEAFDVPPHIAGSTEETTNDAMRWAAAAGQTADRDAVAAAIDQEVGPFGEGVTAFVKALGFRFGPRLPYPGLD
jgi:hypothetical protein